MSVLFKNVTVVTMNPDHPVLYHAFVGVNGKTISVVSTTCPTGNYERVIDGTGKVLMPGLINAHTHLPMTLMRGYGGGCTLQTWLNQYIFPAEDKLDARCVQAGVALALCELIASGVTAVADMYYFCHDIAEVVAQSGISANISRSVTAFSLVEHPEDYYSCKEQVELTEKWDGYHEGQIKVDTSIHAEYTSFESPNLWRYLGDYAAEHNLGMQVHCSETKSEHEDCLERHGKTPIALLDEYGVWQNGGLAAHCVWVTKEDMSIMAERGVTAVHNPVSNLKLASGIAPVPAMIQAGVNVALGTDGVASNNSHDMFEEIKLASLLQKGVHYNPTAISAHTALEMATVNGAKALRRNTGMVAEGKLADLILLDFEAPNLFPCHDVEENLVYSARGSNVVMNMARGTIIYEKGEFQTLDYQQIQYEVQKYALPRIFGK